MAPSLLPYKMATGSSDGRHNPHDSRSHPRPGFKRCRVRSDSCSALRQVDLHIAQDLLEAACGRVCEWDIYSAQGWDDVDRWRGRGVSRLHRKWTPRGGAGDQGPGGSNGLYVASISIPEVLTNRSDRCIQYAAVESASGTTCSTVGLYRKRSFRSLWVCLWGIRGHGRCHQASTPGEYTLSR